MILRIIVISLLAIGVSTATSWTFIACDTACLEESERQEDTTKKTNNLKKQIIGTWTDGSSKHATLKINAGTIYYIDQFVAYKYTITGNTITIKYPDYIFTGKISFLNDTLFIKSSEFEESKFWKFRN